MRMKNCFKLLSVFVLLLSAGSILATEADQLGNEDAGQLVFRKKDAQVFVFRKKLKSQKWQCSPFRQNGRLSLHPYECIVSDFHEDDLSPENVVIQMIYYGIKSDRNSRIKAIACRKIAERINAPATSAILNFEGILAKDIQAFDDAIKDFRARGGDDDSTLADALLVIVETGGSITEINNFADKEQNFFLAFSLWKLYGDWIRMKVSRLNTTTKRLLEREMEKSSSKIIDLYRQQVLAQKKRTEDFSKLCPDQHGPWEYAPPKNPREMQKRLNSCFQAWLKLQSSSPFSEFPEWGSAALEVMQMIRSSELEQKFDTALRNYQKHSKD